MSHVQTEATAWRRHLWLLVLGAMIVLLHAVWLVPGGPWARRPMPLVLGQDEGMALHCALRIVRGEVMYRDFFQFHGPVFYYLHAGLFALVGPSFVAARLMFVAVTTTSSLLLAVLVARQAGRVAGVLAATVHATLLVAIWPFAYPTWYAETLALGGLYFLATDTPSLRRDLLAGALLGLSTLTIQSEGLPVLAAVVVAALGPGLAARRLGAALARPGRILLGAALGVAPFVIYLAAAGALRQMLWGMFAWSNENYQFENTGHYGMLTDEAIESHRRLLGPTWATLGAAALRLNLILPPLALFGGAVGAGLALWHLWKRRDEPGPWTAILLAAACLGGVSTLFFAHVRADFHHIAYGGPFGMLSLSLAARWAWARRPVIAALAAAALLASVCYAHKVAFTWSASRHMADWRGEARKLPLFGSLERATGPDDTIVVGAMAGFYYIFLRPTASPIPHIPSTFTRYLTDGQWRWLADAILTRRPAAMLLVGKQWDEITARRPELRTKYRAQGGLWLRVD